MGGEYEGCGWGVGREYEVIGFGRTVESTLHNLLNRKIPLSIIYILVLAA